VIGGTLSGCVVRHEPAWSTPMDTVLTYQAALAHDDVDAEYRCLSERAKRDFQGRQGYSTFRQSFLDQLGFFGRCALSRNSLEDNLVAARVRPPLADLEFELFGHAFQVTEVADAWFAVEAAGGRVEEGLPLDAPPLRVTPGPDGRPWLGVALELPEDFVAELVRDGVVRVSAEARWKILTPPRLDGELDGQDPLPRGVHHRTIPVNQVHWAPRAATMGYRVVELLLPLDIQSAEMMRTTSRPIVDGRIDWALPPRAPADS